MGLYILLKIWARISMKTWKNLSSKNSQKRLGHAKQSATKRAIQKTWEAAGDLIGNRIVDKSTKVSRSYPKNSSETV